MSDGIMMDKDVKLQVEELLEWIQSLGTTKSMAEHEVTKVLQACERMVIPQELIDRQEKVADTDVRPGLDKSPIVSELIDITTAMAKAAEQSDRIESKLDLFLSKQTKTNDFNVGTAAGKGLAEDGYDPTKCRVKVTTSLLDEWLSEQIEKKGIAQLGRMVKEGRANHLTSVSTGDKCGRCNTGIFNDVNQSGMIVGWHCKCQGIEHGPQTAKPKEDGGNDQEG